MRSAQKKGLTLIKNKEKKIKTRNFASGYSFKATVKT